MDFEQLQQAEKEYDEFMVIGKNIKKRGQIYHIAGMTRCGSEAVLYVLEQEMETKVKKESEMREGEIQKNQTNRINRKSCPENSYFFDIEELKTGKEICSVKETSSSCLGVDNYEMLLLFSDMLRAGWKPQDSPFWSTSWDRLMLTRVVFKLEQEKLPVWQDRISVKLGRRHKTCFVEQPVCLMTGEESMTEFVLEDGRKGVCYINKVYPIDVWKEQEKQFENPKYLERMTREELEEMKQQFYSCLEQSCPKGMCYLGIQYECTLEGSLVFYDTAFLEAESEVCSGSAALLLMRLRPDEPVGKHGYQNRGCIIQTPVRPDIEKLSAELFQFIEFLPEKEELLMNET